MNAESFILPQPYLEPILVAGLGLVTAARRAFEAGGLAGVWSGRVITKSRSALICRSCDPLKYLGYITVSGVSGVKKLGIRVPS